VNKKILIYFLSLLFTCLNAEDKALRKLVFKSDFDKNTELGNWYDVYKFLPQNKEKNSPDPKFCKVITENNESFLRISTMFGVSSLLSPEITIDESLIEIELLVRLRHTEKGRQTQIALTSRREPSGKDGGAFWTGRQDSGIIAVGYDHNVQHANFIAWQKDGRRIQMPVQKEPYNMLDSREIWTGWRLVYNHQEKLLYFYKGTQDAEALIVQHNADLSDSVLNSVWLGGWGTEYLDVKIYCKWKN
jgi:hypothetical protein